MNTKKHFIEVEESYRRYFVVEGQNISHCVKRVEELCNADALDVTNLRAEATSVNEAKFEHNVCQWYQVESGKYPDTDYIHIPMDVNTEEFALKHGSPKFGFAKKISDLLSENDPNLDGSDKYAEGYHDALLDVLELRGMAPETQTHFD